MRGQMFPSSWKNGMTSEQRGERMPEALYHTVERARAVDHAPRLQIWLQRGDQVLEVRRRRSTNTATMITRPIMISWK